MKYLAVLAVAAVLGVIAVGCKNSSSTTAPSTPTQTNTTFTVPLAPANEVPPITGPNADATITGTAIIKLHVIKDTSGTITSATADFQLNASGFPAGAALNMAHIHQAPAGSNAGVLVSTGMAPGTVTITNGTVAYTSNGVNVPADQAQGMLTNPVNYYFNIHTSLNAGGAARGQLGSGGTVTDNPTPAPGY